MNFTPEKKRLIKRRIIYGILLVFVAVFQNTPKTFFEPFGLRQFGVVVMVVCIAMTEGRFHGMILGVIAGLALDVTGGTQGINAILLILIGYVCGMLVHTLIRNNLITAMLFSTVSLFAYVTVYWLKTVVIAGARPVGPVYLNFYLLSLIYTMILMPIWFYIIRFIYKCLPNDPRRRQ